MYVCMYVCMYGHDSIVLHIEFDSAHTHVCIYIHTYIQSVGPLSPHTMALLIHTYIHTYIHT